MNLLSIQTDTFPEICVAQPHQQTLVAPTLVLTPASRGSTRA